MKLKTIRRILAVVFLIGITLLFLDFTGTVQPFFGWMAKLQFLPSLMAYNLLAILAVLALTLLLGRFYCSVICPLGVTQDFFAWVGRWKIFRKNKKSKLANRYSYSKPKTWQRWIVFVVFISMVLAGFNVGASIIAPYSAYGRMVTVCLQPVYNGINNLLAQWAESQDSYVFWRVDTVEVPLFLSTLALVTAHVIGVLAFANGRTYCNTFCPVGTLLGWLAKFSIGKMRVNHDVCGKCGLCAQNCKSSCIRVQKGKPVTIDYTRCVTCGDCESVCTKHAIGFSFQLPKADEDGENTPKPADKADNTACGIAQATDQPSPATSEPAPATDDMSRRTFLAVTGTALGAAVAHAQEKTTDGGLAVLIDKKLPKRHTPITPPGSLSAQRLSVHCTACQLCVANCPSHVLRPSQDFSRFLQPEMQYDRGYCRPECTRCADVCPTGAIRPITIEEKAATQIGHAVWVADNCLPVADKQRCGACARHCPVEAIQMVPADKNCKQDPETGRWTDQDGRWIDMRNALLIPVVNDEKCIGCGKCENLCPARPFSAIYVEGHEQHREV